MGTSIAGYAMQGPTITAQIGLYINQRIVYVGNFVSITNLDLLISSKGTPFAVYERRDSREETFAILDTRCERIDQRYHRTLARSADNVVGQAFIKNSFVAMCRVIATPDDGDRWIDASHVQYGVKRGTQ